MNSTMKKLVFLLILTFLLASPISASEKFSVTVVIDNQEYRFIEPLVNKDGRILVPMRSYFQTLGATVDWNTDTRTVTSTYEDLEIDISIDCNKPKINGIEYMIDVPAQIINDRTYVPLRFVGESLGYQVQWEGDANRVIITKLEQADEIEATYLKQFAPIEDDERDKFTVVSSKIGIASWYGNEFHGRMTASGEVFDQYAYTAAHRTLPFGTYLQVTFLDSNKSVIVRVNDRGPHVSSRVLDLSRGAAEAIGLRPHGLGEVKVEVLEEVSQY